MAAFVDTNVWVYAHDHGAGKKQAVAIDLVANQSENWMVSAQVLAEFYWTVTRKLDPPLELADAADATRAIASLPVVTMDANMVLSAIETAEANQIALWDAQIVEAAVRGGCDRILTEDLNDGQVIRGVEISNPFT